MGPLLDLLLSMFMVTGSWTLIALWLCGTGLLIARPFESQPIGTDAILRSFWLGLAAVVAVLQIAHLFVPVGAWAMAALAGVGTIGVALDGRRLLDLLKRVARRHRLLCVAIALVVVWLANRAIGPGDAHDSGLYHYSAILWIQSFSIVPGLGNLSPPLALGNASFLVTALLDSGPWRFRGEHLANGLLLGAIFVQVVVNAGRLLARRTGDPALGVFHLLLLPILVLLAISKEVSSPKTDLPAAMLTFVLCATVLELLRRRERAATFDAPRVFFVVVIAALALCQKVSTVTVAGGLAVVAVLLLARDPNSDRRALARAFAAGMMVAVLLVVPWCIRNVITSGYFLFPSTWPAAPVEWRVPKAAVEFLNDFTRDHARGGLAEFVGKVFEQAGLDTLASWMSGAEGDGSWVGRWLLSLPITSPVEVVMPLALATLFGVLAAWKRRPVPRDPARWMLAPLLAGLVFWLATAPEPRFAYLVTWSLAAATGALVLSSRWPATWARLSAGTLLAVVLLCVPAFGYRVAVLVLKDHVENPLVMIPFIGPGPDHGFHPRPGPLLTSLYTRSGLEVAYPKRGWDVRCWTTLVCKGWPEIDPGLRLRDRYDLGRGFQIDPEPQTPATGGGGARR